MNVIYGIENYKRSERPVYVALGAFDGIHPGHAALIETVVKKARKSGGESMVLTFHPHPRAFIKGRESFKMISTQDEKLKILEKYGIETVLIIEFDDGFAATTPEEFCGGILHEKLHVSEVFAGFNFCFGANRSGNARSLVEAGEKYGFFVSITAGLEISGFMVSSSKIRLLIETGAVEDVVKFLGRPYTLSGSVVHGDGLGSRLKIPTANIKPDDEDKIIPKAGVYIAECLIGGENYKGLINIGTRPTVYERSSNIVTIELHILNFNGEIYGKETQVTFLKRIRDERRFTDFNMLYAQIQSDIKYALDYFSV
ncbi:MAG TPA: bifunctional riboflavin kinase/FAD synthetase [Candidatus Wallbacteria bacterium]|nr:bifunctional riboflavin kinase/FAD synthetase [Candidatus Wallbacteria bacterium]